jgi:hypothetical protein
MKTTKTMTTKIKIIRTSNARALRADVRLELPRILAALLDPRIGAYEITTAHGTARVIAR